ncbi:MAG: hypothetical protein RL748_2255 [Pseudomonadota bacterium]
MPAATQPILFDFFNLSGKDKASKAISKLFHQSGNQVVKIEVDAKPSRSAGITYRMVHLVFGDSQTVSLGVKASGDIWQVKLNGKLFPMKAQDDPKAAIQDLANAMNQGRAKFQAALAKTSVALPASIRTAAPKMAEVLRGKIADVDAALLAGQEQLTALQAEIAARAAGKNDKNSANAK